MFDQLQDSKIRTAAFNWLVQQVGKYGDVLSRKLLAAGFVLNDIRVPLVGPQGIFKPQILRDAPLSITTAPKGPYDDAFGRDGLLRYRYRGTDPNHRDNQGLRLAMKRSLPLIYFHGLVPGRYVAAWPVYVVGDDPAKLSFSVAVDDAGQLRAESAETDSVHDPGIVARRNYITAAVRVRLHQRAFRERVLDAYHRQCAFCRLRHEELLDAAHIIPDSHPEGEPLVRNGLSLCTLHHSAYDRSFLGLRPDYVIEVRPDILCEHDGPTLVHAIQSLNGTKILVPSRSELRPAVDLVEMRYEQFRKTCLDISGL